MSNIPKRKRINIPFEEETYKQIFLIASKKNISMSEYCRSCINTNLTADVNTENVDLITRIIREQLTDIMKPQIERLAALSAKTCVQSATAAYLSAETISQFVPLDQQRDYLDAYNAARKKAVEYTRRSIDNGED